MIKPSTHAGSSTAGTFDMPALGFGFEVVVGYGYLTRLGPRWRTRGDDHGFG